MIKFSAWVELLTESLDNPYSLIEDKSITDSGRDEIFKSTGAKDYREYYIDAPRSHGHDNILSVYHRNGAYEIHHELENTETQSRLHSTMVGDKPNPRFVSTMFHHAKSLIDSGHSVRIVGHKDNGMFDHYHRIGKIISKRNGYLITEPRSHSETTNNIDSSEYKEFTVRK